MNSRAVWTPTPTLVRQLLAEFTGTALLVAVVVGSGIAAEQLSSADVGLQLLENSIATALGLTVLIMVFGPVSGAHFNPVVSVVDWFLGRTSSRPPGVTALRMVTYTIVQVVGAIIGSWLADAMFGAGVEISTKHRASAGHLLGEVVATFGVVVLIFTLSRTDRSALAAPAVGAYIGAAYWFTSSTSFANPAVTIGRVFSNTFAGIAPLSVGPFIVAQLAGALLAAGFVQLLYPTDISEESKASHDESGHRRRQ